MKTWIQGILGVLALAALAAGCGDSGENKATERGVGEACATTADCRNDDGATADAAAVTLLECLTEFKGGYCGLKDCTKHDECPDGSKCVTADNGTNYCFLVCVEKVDCNVHRTVENEANCVGNATLVDGAKGVKVCVPPSGT